MLRPIRLLLGAVCVAAGATLGALNADPVMLDLGVTRVEAPLGLSLLLTLLLGVLIGGLALMLSVVLPLRRRLRDQAQPQPAREDAGLSSQARDTDARDSSAAGAATGAIDGIPH